jgi:hypothetical protein
MSFRSSHPWLVLLVAALPSSGLLVQSTQAQGTQRSKRDLTSYETNTPDIFRSLNALGVKNDSLQELRDELNKSSSPFSLRQTLDTGESLGPVPMPVTAVQTRRKKDIGHTDGWIANPEELMPGTAAEDYFGFPGMKSNGKDVKEGSWEDIYQRLKQDGSGSTGLGSSVKATARQPTDSQDDDSDMPGAIKDNAEKLKIQLKQSDFGASIFSSKNTKPSFSDFFGVGATGLNPEQAKAHKAYMDTYISSVFGDPSAGVSPNSSGRESSSAVSRVADSSALGALPSVSHSESPRLGSVLNPTLSQTIIPDPNVNALRLWDPLYSDTGPKLDAPKPQPFFTPSMEVPRRRF